MQVIHAIYENGVFRPEEAVNLIPGTRVEVVVPPKTETQAEPTPEQIAARKRV